MFSRTKLPILHKKTIDKKFPPQNAGRDAFPKKIFQRKAQKSPPKKGENIKSRKKENQQPN